MQSAGCLIRVISPWVLTRFISILSNHSETISPCLNRLVRQPKPWSPLSSDLICRSFPVTLSPRCISLYEPKALPLSCSYCSMCVAGRLHYLESRAYQLFFSQMLIVSGVQAWWWQRPVTHWYHRLYTVRIWKRSSSTFSEILLHWSSNLPVGRHFHMVLPRFIVDVLLPLRTHIGVNIKPTVPCCRSYVWWGFPHTDEKWNQAN